MEFSELDELYNYLEEHAGDHKYPHQISKLFQKIRDLKHKAGKSDEVEKAQWEIDCFNYFIKNGELEPFFSGTDDKGHPYEYPDKSKISETELGYIEKRLETTANPILKARYSHILWCSNRKHSKYAKAAIDSYLELIKLYEEKDKNDQKSFYGLDVINSMKEASMLAFKIKYKVDNVRTEIIRLVKDFNFESKSAFRVKLELIRYMIEGKDNFPSESFNGLAVICRDLAHKFFKEGGFHNAIDIFKIGEQVDSKLGLKTHDWNRSIAESYEGLINQRNESDPAVISFCQDAIEYYRKIGDKNKIQELEKKYEYFKGKVHFGTFSQDINLTEFVNQCKEIAQKLCTEKSEKIILVLTLNKDLLPKRKDMEKNAEESSKKTVFLSTISAVITDQRGHTAEHFSTEDEKRYHGILQQYHYSMQLEKQILIDQIFIESVKNNKLNIDIVMSHFEKNSWYGKNITKSVPGGTITYNWLNLVAPSVNDYFIRMQIYFSESTYVPNFILAMDSLVLKIEGLVRDICVFSGITTFYQTKDKQGRSIVREKDINWLLREIPENLFDEDDLLFFKFVLVEQAGFNLRHKIAHCLIDYSEYHMEYMHLLLLVLFRLGKYDFVKPDEAVEEKVADIE